MSVWSWITLAFGLVLGGVLGWFSHTALGKTRMWKGDGIDKPT